MMNNNIQYPFKIPSHAYTDKNMNKVNIRKINDLLTLELLMHIEEVKNPCNEYAEYFLQTGGKIYATDTAGGVCYQLQKIVTIPAWVFAEEKKGKIGKLNSYLSHELAHAKTPIKEQSHGTVFYANYKLLCDRENWHYDFGYKPSMCIMSGILPEDF